MEEKLQMLEEIMDLEDGELKADMELKDIAEYDSMAKLSLIVLMKDEYDKKLSAEEIRRLKTVQDILDIMC